MIIPFSSPAVAEKWRGNDLELTTFLPKNWEVLPRAISAFNKCKPHKIYPNQTLSTTQMCLRTYLRRECVEETRDNDFVIAGGPRSWPRVETARFRRRCRFNGVVSSSMFVV